MGGLNPVTRLQLMSAMLGVSYLPGGPRRNKDAGPERPCVNCKKMKTGDKPFCSAECCKEHREKNKNG